MAANHSGTFMLGADINTLTQMINNPNFLNHLSLSVNSQFMEGNSLRIILKHGVTFTSWGEDINILLTPMGNNSTQIFIRSECAMPTQIIDWGKNKDNVNTIYSVIANNLQSFQSSAASNHNNSAPQPTVQAPAKTQAKFCTACGTPVTPGSNFCSGCGKKL